MLTAVSEHTYNKCSENDTNFDISFVDLELIKAVENKLFKIFEEDKKLVNPVFLFVQDGIISKLAYFLSGHIRRPVAIGIAGGTASGKSTFTFDILDALQKFQDDYRLKSVMTRVNTDDYYYDRSEQVKAAGGFANFAKNYDLDVPDAFELSLLKRHIEQLVLGNNVWLPKYDMSGTAIRHDNHTLAKPSPIIISEGLFCLTDIVKDVFDFCIYVDVSSTSQRERFFKRAAERGLGDAAVKVFDNAVSKAKIYVEPSSKNADIIINGEASREDYKEVANKFIDIVKSVLYSQLVMR